MDIASQIHRARTSFQENAKAEAYGKLSWVKGPNHTFGKYKSKDDAQRRADELNAAAGKKAEAVRTRLPNDQQGLYAKWSELSKEDKETAQRTWIHDLKNTPWLSHEVFTYPVDEDGKLKVSKGIKRFITREDEEKAREKYQQDQAADAAPEMPSEPEVGPEMPQHGMPVQAEAGSSRYHISQMGGKYYVVATVSAKIMSSGYQDRKDAESHMRDLDRADSRPREEAKDSEGTWRSYGPGKFDSIVDSYVYAISMDGADDEVSFGGGEGWAGIMRFQKPGELLKAVEEKAQEEKDNLTAEEKEVLQDIIGVIMSEDSKGFVSISYFTKAETRKMLQHWKHLQDEAAAEEEPEEEPEEKKETRKAKRESIVHHGEGMFIDNDPVEGTTDIFPYVDFVSLERANYGLVKAVLKGDFTIEDTESVGTETFEPIAVLVDFNNAMEVIGNKSAFEEYPFVEVTSEEDYDEASRAADRVIDGWKGPGVYDFRDFSYVSTPEEYEIREMESMADNILDSMFQGDEWKEALANLQKGEGEEDDDRFPFKKEVQAREMCDCSDPGCPVHKAASCDNMGAETVYRIDMEDETGTLMCDKCAEDALASGVFTTEAPDDEERAMESGIDRTEAILHGAEMATVRVGQTRDLMRVQIVMDEHDVRNIDIKKGYEERALSILESIGVSPRKPGFLRRWNAQVLHRDLNFLSTKETYGTLGGAMEVQD